MGHADSDFAKDPVTRKSVLGTSTFLCGDNAEICGAFSDWSRFSSCNKRAQDMIYAKSLLESMDLQVKWFWRWTTKELWIFWTIIVCVEGQGICRQDNTTSVSWRSKEQIVVKWTPGSGSSSDLFTKNLQHRDYNKHAGVYAGNDTWGCIQTQ